MTDCPNCEYHRQRAQRWREEAYKLSGHPLPEREQEPVAWMHTKLDGVVVPHQPADLSRHPDRWEALYRTPPPCPTCEALARTVMLDQTYHDNISPQRTRIELTDDERQRIRTAVLKEKNT
jgi:hypothetical protein